jgi:hypothetical protein
VGRPWRPVLRKRHPGTLLYADPGYDHEAYRDRVRAVQIIPRIARRGTEHGSGLGVSRWACPSGRPHPGTNLSHDLNLTQRHVLSSIVHHQARRRHVTT